jgi:hypothetical protein
MATSIPRTDADFNERQDTITTKAAANIAAWNLDEAWWDGSLLPAKTTWVAKWAAYQNPATRTPLITADKNDARKAYEPLLRTLVGNLEHNTKVTDEERREMGIVVRNGGGAPVPPPSTYPDVTVDTATIRRLVVNFRDHNSERRGRPAGVAGAVLKWGMLDAPPAGPEALTNSALDTASPYTLDFTEGERGKRVYFYVCWQNAKGEMGPWSELASGIIP